VAGGGLLPERLLMTGWVFPAVIWLLSAVRAMAGCLRLGGRGAWGEGLAGRAAGVGG
jgi:hypothetical protein